mmetsp:Transcript_70889/g.189274  ORF Transcript_70889/g.189274 Transcript_70889/m.189274 type:complete len:219 (-) Transcript_70889:146-802(-)
MLEWTLHQVWNNISVLAYVKQNTPCRHSMCLGRKIHWQDLSFSLARPTTRFTLIISLAAGIRCVAMVFRSTFVNCSAAAKAAGAGFRQDTYGRRTGAPAIAAKLPTGGGASAGAAPALAGGHRGHLAHEHVRATRGAPLHRGVPRGGAVPDGYGGRRLYAGALRSLRRHQVGGPRVGALRSPPRQRAGPAHAAVHFGAGRRPAHRAGRGLRRRALRPH